MNGARVCPGNAGVWPVAFGARVSSGVQFAGSAAGTAAGDAAAVVVPPIALLELVLVPGLAQAAARVQAASAMMPKRTPIRGVG